MFLYESLMSELWWSLPIASFLSQGNKELPLKCTDYRQWMTQRHGEDEDVTITLFVYTRPMAIFTIFSLGGGGTGNNF